MAKTLPIVSLNYGIEIVAGQNNNNNSGPMQLSHHVPCTHPAKVIRQLSKLGYCIHTQRTRSHCHLVTAMHTDTSFESCMIHALVAHT